VINPSTGGYDSDGLGRQTDVPIETHSYSPRGGGFRGNAYGRGSYRGFNPNRGGFRPYGNLMHFRIPSNSPLHFIVDSITTLQFLTI
jgi:hypothetical protein